MDNWIMLSNWMSRDANNHLSIKIKSLQMSFNKNLYKVIENGSLKFRFPNN